MENYIIENFCKKKSIFNKNTIEYVRSKNYIFHWLEFEVNFAQLYICNYTILTSIDFYWFVQESTK